MLDLCRPEVAADAIAAVAAEGPLDAVVAVDDQGVRVAALAAERLGLSGNPLEAAAATRDKAAMRRSLAAVGVPQPEHRAVGPGDDPAAAPAEVGLPCVVKPVSLSTSRGVIRADDPRAAAAAAARVRAILAEAGEDPDGPLLIERYVPGAEVAVEGLLRAGSLEPLAVFDKPDALEGPYFEETIFTTPSRLPGGIVAAMTAMTADACAALGLREGPVHAELRVSEGRVWMLELAARSIGGLCSRSLRFGVGVSLEEVILRHALGLPLGDLRREAAASGVMDDASDSPRGPPARGARPGRGARPTPARRLPARPDADTADPATARCRTSTTKSPARCRTQATLNTLVRDRDGFHGRALGERFDESLALKLSGGRADVRPACRDKIVHQRVEQRASLHGFSVGRGVCEQKPFGCPQDAVGFGAEQLHAAELLNETANCFVSVVAGCAGAVHDTLSSVERLCVYRLSGVWLHGEPVGEPVIVLSYDHGNFPRAGRRGRGGGRTAPGALTAAVAARARVLVTGLRPSCEQGCGQRGAGSVL
jgi:formate-dependent phosphoribosylglycinamide formyltransferase (GAR transformylase)